MSKSTGQSDSRNLRRIQLGRKPERTKHNNGIWKGLPIITGGCRVRGGTAIDWDVHAKNIGMSRDQIRVSRLTIPESRL